MLHTSMLPKNVFGPLPSLFHKSTVAQAMQAFLVHLREDQLKIYHGEFALDLLEGGMLQISVHAQHKNAHGFLSEQPVGDSSKRPRIKSR